MTQQWLKCSVSEGMFSNERVISVDVRGGGIQDEFVPADTVEGQGEDGLVKVNVFIRDDGRWAVLPTCYSETIPIERRQLITREST